MTLEWPAAVLIMFLVVVAAIAASTPTRRRHELQLAELKARGHEEYKALAEKFEALARDTHETLAAMQADLAAARVSVEAIEKMMREVS